jgi:CheY-like chemotaxis protein
MAEPSINSRRPVWCVAGTTLAELGTSEGEFMQTMSSSGRDDIEAGIEETGGASRPAEPISLWLVDDNKRLRGLMAELFTRCEDIHCTGTFASPNAVLSTLASKVGPDVILLDVHMGEANGVDAIRPIKSLSRDTRVLMFTTFSDRNLEAQALASGASNYLLKTSPVEKILTCIRQARRAPVPHLRRVRHSSPKASPIGNPVAGPMRDGEGAGLGWVKRCLDRIRNSGSELSRAR